MTLKYLPLTEIPGKITVLPPVGRNQGSTSQAPSTYSYEINEPHFRWNFNTIDPANINSPTGQGISHIHNPTPVEVISFTMQLPPYLWDIHASLYTPPKIYFIDNNGMHSYLGETYIILGIFYIVPHKKN